MLKRVAVYLFNACRRKRWVKRSIATHATKYDDKKRRKPKTVAPFPKSIINMMVLTMHTFKSLLYMLQGD